MVEQINEQLQALVAGEPTIEVSVRFFRLGKAGELLSHFLHGFYGNRAARRLRAFSRRGDAKFLLLFRPPVRHSSATPYPVQDYAAQLIEETKRKNPAEPEFHQAVQEVVESLELVLERHPEYRRAKIIERIIEPERVIIFRVP
ncbi:MAG TPA: hypothetical protein VF551_10070, partial [Chthoniobacterales bacterium]